VVCAFYLTSGDRKLLSLQLFQRSQAEQKFFYSLPLEIYDYLAIIPDGKAIHYYAIAKHTMANIITNFQSQFTIKKILTLQMGVENALRLKVLFQRPLVDNQVR
jgi:hypothetical protein